MSLVSKEIDHLSIKRGAVNRGVVQMARALAWGARGRTFESCHPDVQEQSEWIKLCGGLLELNCVKL